MCTLTLTMSNITKSTSFKSKLLMTKSLFWKVLAFLIGVLLCWRFILWFWDEYKLRRLESSWNGFEQSENAKGCYNFTVVTGLFDIGRGNWWTQSRTYNKYLGHLMQILMLDVNLVIFIEPKGIDFVERMRIGRETRTAIVPTELSNLEYFPLLPRIEEIMKSESFQKDNDNYKNGLPEAVEPLYNLVTNSKTTMIHKAVTQNPFKSDYFIWMDGGYGHGEADLFPPDRIWCPNHLLRHPDKVSFIAFEDLSEEKMKEAETLYRKKTAWIAGGLFAGGASSLERFYSLHKETMFYYMRKGVIDDDQTTFVDCVLRDPENFRPVKGDWYDLMKPFR